MARVPLTGTLLAVLVWFAAGTAQEPDPTRSIVDYLTAKKQDSSLAARKKLFAARFKGENYTGTAEQNTRLLRALFAENKDAHAAAESAKKRLQALPATVAKKGELLVNAAASFPGYVLAEGFGANGSYAARATVRIVGNKVRAADFAISIDSPAAKLGQLQFAGTVAIYVGNAKKPAQTFRLEKAWFRSVGPADATAVFMYAAKGTDIDVPPNTRVEAQVALQPTVATKQGVVALWSNTLRIQLSAAGVKR